MSIEPGEPVNSGSEECRRHHWLDRIEDCEGDNHVMKVGTRLLWAQ